MTFQTHYSAELSIQRNPVACSVEGRMFWGRKLVVKRAVKRWCNIKKTPVMANVRYIWRSSLFFGMHWKQSRVHILPHDLGCCKCHAYLLTAEICGNVPSLTGQKTQRYCLLDCLFPPVNTLLLVDVAHMLSDRSRRDDYLARGSWMATQI